MAIIVLVRKTDTPGSKNVRCLSYIYIFQKKLGALQPTIWMPPHTKGIGTKCIFRLHLYYDIYTQFSFYSKLINLYL
jgi:hypothetical protein